MTAHDATAVAQTAGPKLLTLHVGAPRTGISAVQAFLAANRKLLQQSGVAYPRPPDGARSPKGEPPVGNGDALACGLGASEPEILQRALVLADRTLNRRQGQVLLSSARFWTTTPAGFAALAGHLAGRASLRVIVYVRAQVDQVRSAYMAKAASDGGEGGVRAFFDRDPARFMAGARIGLLRERLGAGNVVVRKYDPGQWSGGDVTTDLLHACGIEVGSDYRRPRAVQPPLDVEHYLYARMAGSQQNFTDTAADRLLRDQILAPVYAKAQPLRGVQVMDLQTARHIADACREDNLQLDGLAPSAPPRLNEDNSRAVEAIAAESDGLLEGLSRASLLLLGRVADLEARMAALKAAAP